MRGEHAVNTIQILWSISPVLAVFCVFLWLLCILVCAVMLCALYGCIWGDGEDVLI